MPASPNFLHQVQVQDHLISADGVQGFNLPPNPISVIWLKLNPLNDTGTLSNYCRPIELAQALNRVSVLHRGTSIVNVRGEDLVAFNYFRHGILPWDANGDDTDNERRSLLIPIILGKFAADKSSCFPATRSGELTLECDFDIADTGYDGLRFSVETLELLGASPKECTRLTAISKTFAATGFQDFDLPNGGLVRSLLLFGTTGFAGAAPAPSWGRMEVLVDNLQYGYAGIDWESARSLHQLMGRMSPEIQYHTHRVDATAASATQETDLPILEPAEGWQNYAFLDFDLDRRDTFSLDTKGSSSFVIRANVETADACRVIMEERMAV